MSVTAEDVKDFIASERAEARAINASVIDPLRVAIPTSANARPEVTEGRLAVFTTPVCPFGHRLWLAAIELLGAGNFDVYNIDLSNKPPWFLSDIYPAGTVPALQFGPDFVLGDSTPCVEWAVAKFGEHKYTDTENAEIKAVMDQFGSKIIGPFYGLLKAQLPEDGTKLAAAVKAGLAWFNSVLEERKAAPFFFGDRFSKLEMLTVTFFDHFRHIHKYWRAFEMFPEGDNPYLVAWMAACDQRPSLSLSTRPADFFSKSYVSMGLKKTVWNA